jgi:hypothetical protein
MVRALVVGPHLAAIEDDGFVSLHLQPALTGITIDGKTVGANIDSIETVLDELETGKQDELVVIATTAAQRLVTDKNKIRGLVGGNNVSLTLDESQLPLQDLVVDLPANVMGVTVDGKAVGSSIDALEAGVAAHDVLLTHRGRAGSEVLTDSAYGMRGLFTDSPNLSLVSLSNAGPSATVDIRLSMSQYLSELIVLQGATQGLFLRDNGGSNQVVVNSTGTATQNLLVNGVLTSAVGVVVSAGADLTTNTIRGTNATEVTMDDNLKVTGALSCDGNLQAANMEATGNLNAG